MVHLKISAEFYTLPYYQEPVEAIFTVESYGKVLNYKTTVPMEFLVKKGLMDNFFENVKITLSERLGLKNEK